MKFRQNAELLEDSMATEVELEGRQALLDHVGKLIGCKIEDDELTVRPYVYDPRNGWDTHIVCIRNVQLRPGLWLFGDKMGPSYFGAFGFTDGPVEPSVGSPEPSEGSRAATEERNRHDERASSAESANGSERKAPEYYIEAIVNTVEANVCSTTSDMAVQADFFQRLAAAFSRLAMATAAFHMGAVRAAGLLEAMPLEPPVPFSDRPGSVADPLLGGGTGRPAAFDPDASAYVFYQCPECEFSSVQRRGADVPDWCPLCAGDSGHRVTMRTRPATSADKPEGHDARLTDTDLAETRLRDEEYERRKDQS